MKSNMYTIGGHHIETYCIALMNQHTPVQPQNKLIGLYSDEIWIDPKLTKIDTLFNDATCINFDLQDPRECFEYFKTFILARKLMSKVAAN